MYNYYICARVFSFNGIARFNELDIVKQVVNYNDVLVVQYKINKYIKINKTEKEKEKKEEK